MEIDIKKKLAKNWFKTLQEVLCQEVEELEKKSNIFKVPKLKLPKFKAPTFSPEQIKKAKEKARKKLNTSIQVQ